MPSTFTLNVQGTKTLQAPVRKIDVGVGSLLVTRNTPGGEDGSVETESETVSAGETYDGRDTPSLSLYSAESCRGAITWSDEVQEAPAPSERASGVSAKRAKKS